MIGISPKQLVELEDALRADPGASCFAALAEAYRRAGRLSEAEEVALQGLERKPEAAEGRLVLAITLIDQGRSEEARTELERLTLGVLSAHGIDAASPGDEEVSESEFDEAFAQAETDTDQLIDPNRVAEEAVVHVDGAADEALDALEPGSDFATATMAELLEAQGDEISAKRIRDALDDSKPAPTAASKQDRRHEQLLETLEGWLTNLRGDRS